CSSCKVFGYVLDECPKNYVSDMENFKNPRQATRGVDVGTKVAFKALKQVYRPISNRNNASSSVTTTAGNAPSKSSYAIITGKPSRKKVNVPTLFTPRGNGIDVVVSMDSIHAISKRFANTTYDGDDATVEQLKKKAKWDNDDYVCRGLILNGMSDSLFDIYQSVESSKEL
nr:zinc finger, CCHC-type [Tanacetum cinerariifolium]